MRSTLMHGTPMRSATIARTLAVTAALVLAGDLAAQGRQDIELAARIAGRELPRAYYERIAQNPRFFEFPDVWGASIAETTGPQLSLVGPTRSGRLPVLVLPALFADSPEPPFGNAAIQQALFTGPSPWGTITEVYREMSGGAFEVVGSTAPWVRSATRLADAVGTSMGLGGDAKLGDHLVQALAAADAQMDFGQFDSNGPDGVPNSADDDGFVDVVAFLTLENAAACGGTGPWPHAGGIASWTGAPFRSQDLRPNGQPVFVNAYIIQDATSCTGTQPLTPAVIAHELGHRIGLPDLYDARLGIGPETRRWVVGCWDLMSAGSWGCGPGAAPTSSKRPTHMGVWSKARLGWVNPTLAANVRDREYVLRPANEGGGALRLPLGRGESLLLEYRVRQGYDVELAGSGVVITHVDTTQSFFAGPVNSLRYGVWTVEGDGDGALMRTSAEGGDRGMAGDVWTALGLATSASGTLLRLNDGTPSAVTIHAIRVDAQARTATIRVTTTPDIEIAALGAAPAWTALSAGERRWRATGGTLPYALNLGAALPPGLSAELRADTIVLSGIPGQAGTFALGGTLLDAMGRTVVLPASTFTIAEPVIPAARLAQSLLRSAGEPLTAAEAAMLDRNGNANGRYDVGDLRAYLRRHPDVERAMASLR